MEKKWYIIHTYSGYENKVKAALEEKINTFSCGHKIEKVVIPTEQVVELVKGQRRTTSRKFYPGYVLVKMELDDETWHVVRSIPRVSGFLGGKDKPTPLSDEEVSKLFQQMEEGAQKPRPKYRFDKGDEVKVIDGPFANFNGVIDEVNEEKGKVRVLVFIFGRATPVELEFVQVMKL